MRPNLSKTNFAMVMAALALAGTVTPVSAATKRHVHRHHPTPQTLQNRSVYMPGPSSAPTSQNFTLPPAGGPSVYQPISPSGTPDLRQRF